MYLHDSINPTLIFFHFKPKGNEFISFFCCCGYEFISCLAVCHVEPKSIIYCSSCSLAHLVTYSHLDYNGPVGPDHVKERSSYYTNLGPATWGTPQQTTSPAAPALFSLWASVHVVEVACFCIKREKSISLGNPPPFVAYTWCRFCSHKLFYEWYLIF